MVTVKVGSLIASTLYLVNVVIGTTSLISRQWATSVRLHFGLWTFCDIQEDEDSVTCSATSSVDHLGWLASVKILVTTGFVLMLFSTVTAFVNILIGVATWRCRGRCCISACCRTVHFSCCLIAAATHGAGNITFGLDVGGASLTHSNRVTGGDQSPTTVGTSWAFICSCCSTGIFLVAVFVDAAVMISANVERPQLQQPAPSAAEPSPPTPLSPVIRVLRFSLSFPGSNSPTTDVCTLSDLIEEEAQHQQHRIKEESL